MESSVLFSWMCLVFTFPFTLRKIKCFFGCFSRSSNAVAGADAQGSGAECSAPTDSSCLQPGSAAPVSCSFQWRGQHFWQLRKQQESAEEEKIWRGRTSPSVGLQGDWSSVLSSGAALVLLVCLGVWTVPQFGPGLDLLFYLRVQHTETPLWPTHT